MSSFNYDCIVLGGGAAGLVASKFGSGIGKRVALIEKEKIGGECTWTGCVPSKTFINAANSASTVSHLSRFGLTTTSPMELDTGGLMNHVQKVVQQVAATHTPEILKKAGISIYFGNPIFIDNHTIEVSDKKLTAKNFILTTGSRPYIPPIEGLESVEYMTNENFFSQKTLPKSLTILGGGAIGVELGCALNNLGVSVTIIEMNDILLSHQDMELATLLTEYLIEDGVVVKNNLKAIKVEQNNGIAVHCIDKAGNKHVITNEKLLVAVGRAPNIESLGLDVVGIKATKQGITVNNQLQTTVKNIYAAGDVVGPYLFSHMAYYQASIAARNALLPLWSSVDYTDIIWTIFANPEFSSAGLTQDEAEERFGSKKLKIYRMDYKKLDRAYNDSVDRGMGNVICCNGKIVGAHILGKRAGEVIHELQLGKTMNIPFTKFYSVIHAYPTYSELVWQMAKGAYIEKLQSNWFIKNIKRLATFFGGAKE